MQTIDRTIALSITENTNLLTKSLIMLKLREKCKKIINTKIALMQIDKFINLYYRLFTRFKDCERIRSVTFLQCNI